MRRFGSSLSRLNYELLPKGNLTMPGKILTFGDGPSPSASKSIVDVKLARVSYRAARGNALCSTASKSGIVATEGDAGIAWRLIAVYWLPNPELYKPWLRSRIRSGRGIGQGPPYTAWFNVRDVPSRGNAHVYLGAKILRLFHLLSDYEAIHFLLLERDPAVIDIRENFPIFDIDWTVEACVMHRIRHPYKNGYPDPFTLDFVVTRSIENHALDFVESVKTPEHAANKDVKLRLSVESNWCRLRPKVPYGLIDTTPYIDTPLSSDITPHLDKHKRLLSALEFMRAWFLHRYEPDLQRELRFERAFSGAFERNMPLEELNRKIALMMRVPEGLAMDMFRFCSWHDRLPVSLKYPLALNFPVHLR
jgi:hypothetical protein